MGTISRDLGNCIERLCEAGADRQLWVIGLENLCHALNAQGILVIPRHHPYLILDFPLSPSLEEFAHRFAWEDWSRRSPEFATLWSPWDERHDVTLVPDFVTDAEFESVPLFQDLFRTQGTRWWIGILFNMNGEECVLSIHRRVDQRAFDRDDKRTLHRLRRHLVHPFIACDQVVRSQDLGELNAFQRLNRAAVLLDRSGRVVSWNERIVGFDADLLIGEERLFASNREVNDVLQAKISRAISKAIAGDQEVDEPMLIERPNKLPLVVHFFAVSERHNARYGRSKILLSAFDPTDRWSAAANLGARLFSLSRAETRLVVHLSGGESVREAAAGLNISYGTARTQLKSIFLKANVRRQSDLVGLFLSLHD